MYIPITGLHIIFFSQKPLAEVWRMYVLHLHLKAAGAQAMNIHALWPSYNSVPSCKMLISELSSLDQREEL